MSEDSDDFGPMIGADSVIDGSSTGVVVGCLPELGRQPIEKPRGEEEEGGELSKLRGEVEMLKEQKRQTEKVYDHQRARFMELFTQKEDELKSASRNATELQLRLDQMAASLDDARTALVICELNKADELAEVRNSMNSEIASLQHILAAREDGGGLEGGRREEYEREIAQLKAQLFNFTNHTATSSSAVDSGFLSTITKTLHKRVGSATLNLTSHVTPAPANDDQDDESLEESMKKAQADTEMLRAVITPLELEIQELKATLRIYEQTYGILAPSSESINDDNISSNHKTSDGASTLAKKNEIIPGANVNGASMRQHDSDSSITATTATKTINNTPRTTTKTTAANKGKPGTITSRCEQCGALEKNLTLAHNFNMKLQEQLQTAQRHLEAERESARTLEAYREELEHSLRVAAADSEQQNDGTEQILAATRRQCIDAQNFFNEQLKSMTCYREDLQNELTRLQTENESLVGRHSKHAQQLQEEYINLPNTIEELQVLVLRYREEVITTKVAQEHSAQHAQNDVEFLRLQLQELRSIADNKTQRINELEEELATQCSISSELERQKNERLQAHPDTKLQIKVQELTMDKTRLEQTNQMLTTQLNSFRHELTNNESVQRDLIDLSKSLQIQLEKIRSAESGVRWQHEDDITQCTNCSAQFNDSLAKAHCRHCGQIFCSSCLDQNVASGPHNRPAAVCKLCYTLLVKDSPPFFNLLPPTDKQ